jgi:uncharacterized protein
MTTIEAPQGAAGQADPRKTGVIDSDVHPNFVNGIRDLTPYMSQTWKNRLGVSSDDWAKGMAAAQFTLPLDYLYINAAGAYREDAARPGMPPASDPDFTAEHLLDTYGTYRAVLLAGQCLGIGSMPDGMVAATIASAYNEWMCERWLQNDQRWRGALVVAPQDPEAAVAEIDRVAKRPGIVAVFMPLGEILMGEKHYWPIYEACSRHELPLIVHPSGTENVFAKAPKMAGTPTFYLEWHTALGQIHQSNTLSMICHGVFEKFPKLKYIIAEGGFLWALEVMWKLDRDWKGLRNEVPWLTRPPSEYLLEHIRFTTQPFIEPHDPRHLAPLMEMLHADQVLLYSSDYPHWDFDSPARALNGLSKELRHKIQVETPRAVYGDRLD